MFYKKEEKEIHRKIQKFRHQLDINSYRTTDITRNLGIKATNEAQEPRSLIEFTE